MIDEIEKKLIVKIPPEILSNVDLSLNEKLILGLDYTFTDKLGVNLLSNIQVASLFNLHINIVSYCRKNLIKKGYISKNKRQYFLSERIKFSNLSCNDRRVIYLPFEIYNHFELLTGSKLLWGEYNSLSKGEKEYFASREFTAQRLNASKESVTNWTKQLSQYNLLDQYSHKHGYCTKQKIIITCKF